MAKGTNLQVIKMSKIGTKLFIIILLMSVGGLIAAAFLINSRIDLHFEEYIYLEQEQELQGIKELIENNYQKDNNWENIDELLDNYIHGRRVIIELVETKNNNTIFSNLDSPGYGRRHGEYDRETAESLTIKDNREETAAYLYWALPGQNRFEIEHSSIFLENVNQTVFWIASIMVILTIIVSFLFSRSFTRPLLKMNKLASAITRGNYKQEINIRGNDEISELGKSLNKMSSRLHYLEKIRKESTEDLAHELRTPLSIISSYITGLKDGVLPPDNTTLKEMEEELKRLIRLVNRLEDLAESEQKIINLNPEKINLKSLLEKIISFYRKKADQKNIKIEKKYHGKNFTMMGDKDALKTIIVNLLTNAIKYTTRQGEIIINLSENKETLILKIKNTGVNIPEKDLPYIFTRFYRTDKSRSTKTGGIGLGLTITRKLVRAHKGKISAANKENYTVFTVSLPIEQK